MQRKRNQNRENVQVVVYVKCQSQRVFSESYSSDLRVCLAVQPRNPVSSRTKLTRSLRFLQSKQIFLNHLLYSTVINCVFIFRTTHIFSCFCNIIHRFELGKQVSALDYVVCWCGLFLNHTRCKVMDNISGHYIKLTKQNSFHSLNCHRHMTYVVHSIGRQTFLYRHLKFS